MFFFACFFRKPSLTFCQIDQQFFYFVALISFSRNLSNIFIYVVGLTFQKIGLMFFFWNVFFYRLLSLDFGFFSDLKQRN